MPKTGGQLIAESLDRNQVRNIFCVPGESYLGALDALFDKKKSPKASIRLAFTLALTFKHLNLALSYKSLAHSSTGTKLRVKALYTRLLLVNLRF